MLTFKMKHRLRGEYETQITQQEGNTDFPEMAGFGKRAVNRNAKIRRKTNKRASLSSIPPIRKTRLAMLFTRS